MKTTNSLRSRASHFFSDRYACTRTAGFFSRACRLRNNPDRCNPVAGLRDNNDDIEMNAITMAHKVDSYANLLQQIRNDLRLQHPDWIQPNGQCPDV